MRGADHFQSDLELYIVIGGIAFGEIAMPRQEMIDPRFDRAKVEAELLDVDFGAPAIVAERRHARFTHLFFRRMPILHDGGDEIVSVGEDVGFNDDAIADDTLRRKEAAVDLRLHSFDDYASTAVEFHECGGRCQIWARHSCVAAGQECLARTQRNLRANGLTMMPRMDPTGRSFSCVRRTICSMAR